MYDYFDRIMQNRIEYIDGVYVVHNADSFDFDNVNYWENE